MKGWDARLERDVEDYYGGPDDLWDGRVDIHETFKHEGQTCRIVGTFEAESVSHIDLSREMDKGRLRVQRLDALSVWVPVHEWAEPDSLWDAAYRVCEAAWEWAWDNTTHIYDSEDY